MAMSSLLKDTISCLRSLEIIPSKKHGQNFLVDKNIVQKLITSSDIMPGDTIVEVGCGLGTITQELLQHDIKLYGIEIDQRLYNFLTDKFRHLSHCHILYGDAVEYPVANISTKINDYKIIANIPYAISSPWIDGVLSQNNLPKTINIIIQSDTAERFCAQVNSSEYSPTTIILQSAYCCISKYKIPRQAFYPIPHIDSVILSLEKLNNPFQFNKITKRHMRDIFTQRRKQIQKILRTYDNRFNEWLTKCSIDKQSRPGNITIQQWQQLDTILHLS